MPRFNPDDRSATLIAEGEPHSHSSFAHLRTKLRWQLLIAYLTPLLVLAAFFHFQYTTTHRESIDNHLKSIAESQRDTVDLYLRERAANLRSAFRSAAIDSDPDTLDLAALLAQLRLESPAFVDVGLFNPEGTLIAYAGPHQKLVGKRYSEEDWWLRLQVQERGYYISDVYLGFRRQPHFIIAVRRILGHDTWVLRASVDPQKFTDFVRSSYLVGSAEAFIVNAAGARQTLSPEGNGDTQKDGWVPPRSTDLRVVEVDDEGRDYLAAVAWLAETDWALVARIPSRAAYAPVRKARWISLAIMIGAVALILVIVFRYTASSVAELEAADRARENLRFQLFHAAKLASVGEMAAGVAHEINNPLAVIYEEAGMMQDILDPEFGQTVDPDDFRERLGAILDATIRGRTITRKLLAFSRQHDERKTETDVNRLVEGVIEVKAREFELSDIEVVRDFDERLPELSLNRNQMDQVLLNLLNNARDAITGPGQITVRTQRDGDWVCIDVTDTGCGMSAAVMQNIFFPFYTTKGVGKGTGLGLSISYGLIKAAGGEIEVDSEVGRGTTVTLRLPLEAKRQRRTRSLKVPHVGSDQASNEHGSSAGVGI